MKEQVMYSCSLVKGSINVGWSRGQGWGREIKNLVYFLKGLVTS